MLRIVLNPREKKNIAHKWKNDFRLQKKYTLLFVSRNLQLNRRKNLLPSFFFARWGRNEKFL